MKPTAMRAGRALEQAAIDRAASPSSVLARCDTCGHWNQEGARWCSDCKLPFVARPATGLPVVR